MKLLYAEDEPAMAEAVTDVLTYHNYLVDRVADGEEALDYARSETYDGISLDVMMPRLDGLAVVETLMRNQGLYLSSEDLLVKVWGYNAQAEIGTVWVYISYLRKRLAALGSRVTVKARRGVGYTLEAGG